MRIRTASTSSKSLSLFSTTNPAIKSKITAKPKTGIDWRKTLRKRSKEVLREKIRTIIDTKAMTKAKPFVRSDLSAK